MREDCGSSAYWDVQGDGVVGAGNGGCAVMESDQTQVLPSLGYGSIHMEQKICDQWEIWTFGSSPHAPCRAPRSYL